jgi:hypothetical protein
MNPVHHRCFERTALPGAALAIAALLAVLAIAGCGKGNLVLKVDVLSYLAAGQTDFDFGPVPAAPGGIATGEQNVISDASINLVGNLSDVANVHSVSIRSVVAAESFTGGGSDTLRLYLSDPDTDPRTTPAVLEQALVLVPAGTDTVTTEIAGDARVIDLFTRKSMRVTITTSLRGPDSGADLTGHVHFIALDAVVIAGHKGQSGP